MIEKLLGIEDRKLHFVLFGGIVILLATTVYFRFIWQPPDPFNEIFLSKITQFDLEHSLQEKAEVVKPGAIEVPILIYHSVRPHGPEESFLQKYYDVSPDSFTRQMEYLKNHDHTVISFDYLVQALKENITLPEKSIVITFDDGWRSQYSYAFPVLRKYKYTATFFIYTDGIGHDYFLDWDQVRVMNNSGMTIGGHTESHPYLVGITDPEVLREEIIGGKRIIEDRIGQPIEIFAYPYGHYSDKVIDIVKEAGYVAARSTYKGIHHTKDDLFKMKGIEVTDDFDKFVKDINY